MAEDLDDDSASAPGGGTGGVNPSALDAAMTGASAATEEARDFLRRQSALTDLQAKILHEQHALELSHLRWRRFGDQMKGALQIFVVILGLLLLILAGATLWNASEATGLVVESFSVPPDFTARGIGGDVLAADLTNRIAAIRRNGALTSYSSSHDVRSARQDDIRVEIPDTGISLGEVWRYLSGWLGHERRLEGSLRDLGNGRISLTAMLAGEDSFALTGPASDLDRMEQQAAERIFSGVDPVNYIIYLVHQRRFRDAEAVAARHAQTASTPAARADAYTLWAASSVWGGGDPKAALARVKIGISIDPLVAVAHVYAARMYESLGHDEQALAEAWKVSALRDSDQPLQHQGHGFAMMRAEALSDTMGLLGDFGEQEFENGTIVDSDSLRLMAMAYGKARLHDVTASRESLAQAMTIGGVSPDILWQVRYRDDKAAENWRAAVKDLAELLGESHSASSQFSRTAAAQSEAYRTASTEWRPLLARAYAQVGDYRQAHAEIDATPGDCYDCLRMRGDIDAVQKNAAGASFWFTRATLMAPSIPFAYSDWGAMLLREGQYDDAIDKFREANLKGPHFADPIEMWGEALMQENRSDLALAKFEEAKKYAPNWGRLHLKWGKALFYAGKKDEAKRQFAIAAGLDLPIADKSELARMRAAHG